MSKIQVELNSTLAGSQNVWYYKINCTTGSLWLRKVKNSYLRLAYADVMCNHHELFLVYLIRR